MVDKENTALWIESPQCVVQKSTKPPHSYWWQLARTFASDRLGVIGVLLMVAILLFAMVGPIFATHNYKEMRLELGNIAPCLDLYQIDTDSYLYLHPDYYFIRVTENGEIVERLKETENDLQSRCKIFEIDGHMILVDYSFVAKAKAEGKIAAQKYAVYLDGEPITTTMTVWNRTYIFGSDSLGRDLYARVLSGARISLLIAICSTLINTVIGVLYGGIAGYCGKHLDIIMMRIVDVLSTVPVTLIMIMLMVVIGSGVKTVIIAMGIANWCTMARVVRSQVLSLKQQEFVQAAIVANATHLRVLLCHLIPNIASSIVVCMTMLVPGAIFNEAFLSFIGLGVTVPNASWGTLVSEGLASIRSFPYQVMIPSAAICITILAMNLIGNALQHTVNQCEER